MLTLALVYDVYCDFVPFPFGIVGQVWYLIVSIPDPCCLSYFDHSVCKRVDKMFYHLQGNFRFLNSKFLV